MKNSNRALRRYRLALRKRWVRKNLRHCFDEDLEPRRVGMYAETPKVCSCWMCGNPRRYHGELSMQERRAMEAEAIGWTLGDSVEPDTRSVQDPSP